MYDLRHFTVRLYQWQYIEDTKTMLVHSVLFCIKTICKRNRFNIICKDNIGMILVIIIYTEKIFKMWQIEIQIVFFGVFCCECYEIFH